MMPRRIPKQKANPNWLQDKLAGNEGKNWENEQKIQQIQHENSMRWHRATGLIVWLFMWAFTILVLTSFSVWFWHYLTPWEWLSPEQLDKVRALIFNGSLGAVFSIVIQKYFRA